MARIGNRLPYVEARASQRMVAQEQALSCLVACVRQLLLDVVPPVAMSEGELAMEIGVRGDLGSDFGTAARVLTEHHPFLSYRAGSPDLEILNFTRLQQGGSWIARLRLTTGGHHAVIVDGMVDNFVRVRDPWGLEALNSQSGVEATIQVDAFLEHWRWGIHHGIFPVGSKRGIHE